MPLSEMLSNASPRACIQFTGFFLGWLLEQTPSAWYCFWACLSRTGLLLCSPVLCLYILMLGPLGALLILKEPPSAGLASPREYRAHTFQIQPNQSRAHTLSSSFLGLSPSELLSHYPGDPPGQMLDDGRDDISVPRSAGIVHTSQCTLPFLFLPVETTRNVTAWNSGKAVLKM